MSVEKECMTVSSKIRIYDLAKELKLDTKRLIEEVRREGVDVSVPSNSVSKELAEKIRNKYFPKKETRLSAPLRSSSARRCRLRKHLWPRPEPEVQHEPNRSQRSAASTGRSPQPMLLRQPAKPPVTRLVKKLTSGSTCGSCRSSRGRSSGSACRRARVAGY